MDGLAAVAFPGGFRIVCNKERSLLMLMSIDRSDDAVYAVVKADDPDPIRSLVKGFANLQTALPDF